MIFKDSNTYDRLRLIGQIFIPVSAFIASMMEIFDVTHADIVTAVLTAVDMLIGSLITISKQEYDKRQKEEEEE